VTCIFIREKKSGKLILDRNHSLELGENIQDRVTFLA
jgi:hypothetical protein